MTTNVNFYTVTEAGTILDLTRVRVWQLVTKLGLGMRDGKRIILTDDDIDVIRNRDTLKYGGQARLNRS